MAETATDNLLSGEFIHKLDRLDVVSRKILQGKLQGERRSKRKGQSVEFADYRNYVPGDDLRFIDWNLYARLDKLFLRLFMEEEDLSVTVVFDATSSMRYGNPEKFHYARQIAAALGYIGLSHHNRVSVYGFGQQLTPLMRHARGRRPLPRVLEAIGRYEIGERTHGHLAEAMKRLAALERQKGVVILVSDFLDKGDLGEAFRYLLGERYDAYAIQILSPQELDPQEGQILGDLKLEDLEDGDFAEVSVGPALIKRYRATLQEFCEHVREQCLRRGVAYLFSDTSVPFDTLVLQYLRRRGLLR